MSKTIGTFCSGIGSAELAARSLGWTCKWSSEIEPFPSAVLAHHFPDTPNHGDMTKLHGGDLERVDVVFAGTPCQSFSVAGLRAGMADPRGNLALDLLRLVDTIRPRWLVWENVPGVLSSNGGRDFGSFVGALGQLGYGFAYRILDAQFVRTHGHERAVPQRRRRVFVVGHSDWRRAAAVLFERESMSGNPAPSRTAGEGIAREVANGLRSGGAGTSRVGDARGQDNVVADIAKSLNAHGMRLDTETETFVTACFDERNVNSKINRSQCKPDISATIHSAPMAIAFKSGQSEAAGGTFVTEEFSPTLQSQNNGSTSVPCVAFAQNQIGEVRTSNIAGTSNQNQNAIGRNTAMAHTPYGVRRLMPIECERLQGFPDNYTAITYRNKPAADSPRYKAIGNSIAVNCSRWILERIAMVDSLASEAA